VIENGAKILSNALVALVAIEHLGFLVLEMFFWTKPAGRRVFRLTPEKARDSAPLAANQGLYNGFLAAGLVWSLLHPFDAICFQLKLFFLSCVIVAGAYGAYSVNRRIFVVQAVPGLLALLVTLWASA
jgi:putative membrane protein